MTFVVMLDGEGRVESDGSKLSFRTKKSIELIYFLAVHGESSRVELGRQLWPELESDRRGANVRLSLNYVRKVAGGLILSEGKLLKLNAEVISTPEHQILVGFDSAWAVAARESHMRASTQKYLADAEIGGDMETAILARDSDPYLQAPRLLIARLWMDRGEPAKAAAELREYAELVRRKLGLDIAHELFTQVGLTIDSAHPGAAQAFESLSPRERVMAVVGQCPSWLASGRIFYARTRLEQVSNLKVSKTLKCELYRWVARFECEAGEFASAVASSMMAMKMAQSSMERVGAELVLLRAKLFLMQLEEVSLRVEKLRTAKLSDEMKADLAMIGAITSYYQNRPGDSIVFSAESFRAAERAQSQFRVASALGMLGSAHFLAGDMRSASDYAGQAAEVAGRYGMRIREANYLGLKGRSEEALENLEEAERLYLKSVEMVTATDSLHIYGVLVTYLGDLLVKRGRAKAGLEWLKKGALARRHSSDVLGQSTSNRCLARGYLALGRVSDAEGYARRAMELALSSGRAFELALNEVILAEIEFARGRREDGAAYLRKALPAVRREHRLGRSSAAEDPIYDPDRIAGVLAHLGSA